MIKMKIDRDKLQFVLGVTGCLVFSMLMIWVVYKAEEGYGLRQNLYNKCITEQYEKFTQLAPHQLGQYCRAKSRTLINEKDL
jgi:hypothetical protein